MSVGGVGVWELRGYNDLDSIERLKSLLIFGCVCIGFGIWNRV